MPGARGPVPARSEQRRRRNKVDVDTPEPQGAAVGVAWPDPDPSWHEIARDWFTSLGESGQAVYYQPSDVARARYVASAMSRNLSEGRFSAQLFAAVNTAAGELCDTEGSRRRLRIELERATPDDPQAQAGRAAVASLKDARSRMESARTG